MSQLISVEKPMMQSLEQWNNDLALSQSNGWQIIQIFRSIDGVLTALLRKDIQ